MKKQVCWNLMVLKAWNTSLHAASTLPQRRTTPLLFLQGGVENCNQTTEIPTSKRPHSYNCQSLSSVEIQDKNLLQRGYSKDFTDWGPTFQFTFKNALSSQKYLCQTHDNKHKKYDYSINSFQTILFVTAGQLVSSWLTLPISSCCTADIFVLIAIKVPQDHF